MPSKKSAQDRTVATEIIPIPRYPRGVWFLVGSILFIVVGALAIWRIPALLLDTWLPDAEPEIRASSLGSATQAVLLALGGVIAVIGVALSLSRHGNELKASARETRLAQNEIHRYHLESTKENARRKGEEMRVSLDVRKELRDRFVSSVSLMAHSSGISRKAGILALAALVDDWKTRMEDRAQAQAVIDVICGYLRGPMPEDEALRIEEQDIRNVGFSLIRERLSKQNADHPSAWHGFKFNFANSVISTLVDLSSLSLTADTRIDFSGAQITGGQIDLSLSQLSANARIDLGRVKLTEGAGIDLTWVSIKGTSRINLGHAEMQPATRIEFDLLTAKEKSAVEADHMKIHDESNLDFRFMTFNDEAHLALGHSQTSGCIDFTGSTFRGAANLRVQELEIYGEGSLQFEHDELSVRQPLTTGNLQLTFQPETYDEGLKFQARTKPISDISL